MPPSPPESGEEEDRQHAAEGKIPPYPVACNAAIGHKLRDGKRRVGSKGRCDHAGPRKVPGHVAPTQEILCGTPAGAPVIEKGLSRMIPGNTGRRETSRVESCGGAAVRHKVGINFWARRNRIQLFRYRFKFHPLVRRPRPVRGPCQRYPATFRQLPTHHVRDFRLSACPSSG